MAINIVDVSNVMHVGHHRFKDASVQAVNSAEIKTGALYNLLRLFTLRKFNFTKDTWCFCFDSATNRFDIAASKGMSYKSNRNPSDPNLKIQLALAEKWMRDSGFNVYKFDGFEADDIIGTLATAFKPTGIKVNVITGDRDMAYLVDENTNLISPSTNSPDVTFENYLYTAGKRGERVHYNSILLYKVLCGDNTDSIKQAVRKSYSYYNKFCSSLQDFGIDLSILSDFNSVETVIDSLTEPVKTNAKNNWELIQPRFVPEEWLTINPLNLDTKVFSDFLHLFDMKSILRKFKLPVLTPLPEFVMKERIRIVEETNRMVMEGGWVASVVTSLDPEFSSNEEDLGLEPLEELDIIEKNNKDIEESFKAINEEPTPEPLTERNEKTSDEDNQRKDNLSTSENNQVVISTDFKQKD